MWLPERFYGLGLFVSALRWNRFLRPKAVNVDSLNHHPRCAADQHAVGKKIKEVDKQELRLHRRASQCDSLLLAAGKGSGPTTRKIRDLAEIEFLIETPLSFITG